MAGLSLGDFLSAEDDSLGLHPDHGKMATLANSLYLHTVVLTDDL